MKYLAIILAISLLAGCGAHSNQQEPIPTYVIKVWASDDPKREVKIEIQRHSDSEEIIPTVTPATAYINADRPLDYRVRSLGGEPLDAELRFQFKEKDELIGRWEHGERLTFTQPARSE